MSQSLLLHSDLREQLSWNSTQISESQGIQSSKQSVQVSGSSYQPKLLDASIIFIFCLVLRADNVPGIKKYPFLKRKLFVSVSNDSDKTTAKTAEASVQGQMAKWNEVLDPLYVFPLSLQFMAKQFHLVL